MHFVRINPQLTSHSALALIAFLSHMSPGPLISVSAYQHKIKLPPNLGGHFGVSACPCNILCNIGIHTKILFIFYLNQKLARCLLFYFLNLATIGIQRKIKGTFIGVTNTSKLIKQPHLLEQITCLFLSYFMQTILKARNKTEIQGK